MNNDGRYLPLEQMAANIVDTAGRWIRNGGQEISRLNKWRMISGHRVAAAIGRRLSLHLIFYVESCIINVI